MVAFYKGDLGNFINESLEDIVSSGIATNSGKYFCELQQKIEEYLCPRKVALVASGTHALTMSLLALERAGLIQPKARVLVPSFTFIASIQAILLANMRPVFADIDMETWTIDIRNTQGDFDCVMPVNIFGVQPEIATKYPIVHDLSHGFGGSLNGKRNGTTGTMCAFSCSITKPFHTIEGGIVTSDSEEIIKDVSSMARWHLTKDYDCIGPGQWSKLSEVHAVAGLESFKTFEQTIQKKDQIVAAYKEALSGLPITFQKIPDNCRTTHKDFAILVPANKRAKIIEMFESEGIGYKLYFSPAIHQTKQFRLSPWALPITTNIASRIICLPVHRWVSDGDIERISSIVRKCL